MKALKRLRFSIRGYFRPSVHRSLRPSVRPSVRTSVRPSVRPSVLLVLRGSKITSEASQRVSGISEGLGGLQGPSVYMNSFGSAAVPQQDNTPGDHLIVIENDLNCASFECKVIKLLKYTTYRPVQSYISVSPRLTLTDLERVRTREGLYSQSQYSRCGGEGIRKRLEGAW